MSIASACARFPALMACGRSAYDSRSRSREEHDMGVNHDTENRTTQNTRCALVSRSRPFLLGLVVTSTVLASCATPESLGDKEEYARLSGKGAVIGIHQGLESVDDPVVNKIRTELLNDEILQRKV